MLKSAGIEFCFLIVLFAACTMLRRALAIRAYEMICYSILLQEAIESVRSMTGGPQTDTSASAAPTVHMTVSLFRPFQPMLAQRLDQRDFKPLFESSTVVRTLQGKLFQGSASPEKQPADVVYQYFLESKYDGERLLCHIDKRNEAGPKMKLFTRRSNDYTEHYGKALGSVILDHVR